MPMTVSVELDELRDAAIVTVDGIDAGAATYTIQRTSPSGNTAGVRGHVNEPAIVTVIAHDYEVPLNLDVVYTATAYDQAGAVHETASALAFRVDYAACESWLVDIARPTNSIILVIESMTALDYAFAVGVHRVLNRRAPVLTTLPAWTPGSELVVLTDTLDERDQVRALLGNGYPMLLRTSPDIGIGNMYCGITAFIEERFLTLGNRPERRFRIQVVQVDRPDPGYYVPLPPNTYANVEATYATYGDLEAAVGTYDELAYTYPPDLEASPIEPWPPDDI